MKNVWTWVFPVGTVSVVLRVGSGEKGASSLLVELGVQFRISWKRFINRNCGIPRSWSVLPEQFPCTQCFVVPTSMVLLLQAERVKENARHDMPSVFPCSRTALTGDDLSYFGASRQALVRVPVSSAVYRVPKCTECSNTPLSGQNSIN